jgi:gliding motility-associated lipoprotein GldD
MIHLKPFYFLLFAICLLSVVACDEAVYTPKPRGFPRVVYPAKEYQPFDRNYCNFTFEYPKYAQIVQDTSFFDEKPADECWFDIYVPQYEARIHCSYYPIDSKNPFSKLASDAFVLADKHNVKADFIDQLKIQKPNHVSGFAFDIEGPVASPFQFFLTDSTKHFVRGALYFKTSSRPDSLRPVVDFMKKDIMQMINTFEWNR